MTLEEAKKILEKEGFYVQKATRPCAISEAFTEYENPTICEAMQVVSSAGYFVCMEKSCFDERKARLKKELEEHANAPVSGKEKAKEENPALKEAASQFNDALLDEQAKQIDKQNKEITRLLSLVEKKENSISRLYYEKSVLEKENEELKKGEIPAKYFDKALVDEQAEKIEKLTKENEDWKSWNEMQNRAIAINNIAFRDEKNRLGKEIARLNGIIHKKNMKIEEFRKESSRHLRGKIKVFYENVDLEGKLKDKDAVLSDVAEELRLTKIREKNLTEVCQKYMKENEELKKELADKVVDKIDAHALKSAESALACKEQLIYYKDKIIANNKKKIAEKDEVIADLGNELAATKKELEEKIKLVETVCNASKEYCEYGIAAEKMIQKLADIIVYDRPVFSKDFEQYRRWANGCRFNPQLPELSEEEEKKLSSGRDNHPTEDNPEEVEVDEILERVRKALEEGHTVSIDYEM